MWALLALTAGGEPDSDAARGGVVSAGRRAGVRRALRPLGIAIFGYVYRSVGDPALAEELTQDVFLKAFLHLRRTAARRRPSRPGSTGSPPPPHRRHRAAARRPAAVRDGRRLAWWPMRDAGDPEQRADPARARRAVRRTLDALPAHYRQALILRQLQGLSYAEIGEALGISVEAVTSLIHRARRHSAPPMPAAAGDRKMNDAHETLGPAALRVS